jgi:hypothetical protein
LSAICISGAGGLMLGWAIVVPGERSRGQALRQASGEGIALLGGAVAMLVVAGLIEGYVTPHASAPVRWTVAGTSGVLLALYLGLAGRGSFPLTPAPGEMGRA